MAANARDAPANSFETCQQLVDIRLIHRVRRKLRAIQQVGIAGDDVVPVCVPCRGYSGRRC